MSLPESPTVPHCYRHPDREAGRSCTRCGKPACSDCLVQASVGSHCLDCAKAGRPDTSTRVRMATSRVLTPATYTLIAINVVIFVLMGAADSATFSGNRITEWHAKLGLNKGLLQYGIPGLYHSHEWYRLITSGFIHFGALHVLMNMVLLFQLGQMLERALGTTKFVLAYFACLLAGSLGILVQDLNGLAGGASGAVFGLMGLAAIGLHRRGVNVFSTGIGMTLALNIVFSFSIKGIALGGHLGGLVGGVACGWVMLAPAWRPQPRWASWAAPAAVAVVSLAACFVLAG